jgi:AraC family transcriptional regulator, regulatory protein of adaptative response / DNA-3-methyladenine glycosylase II
VRGWTTLGLDLPFRPPLLPDNLFGHLAATAVPGVEEWRDGAYRCTLRLPGGPGIATLRPAPAGASAVPAVLHLADAADADSAVATCRRILDLDADPDAVDGRLALDPVLAPLVAAAPGRRVPGTADAEQFAVRAVLGQQVSTAAARTHAGRLVAALGDPVDDPAGGLTHLFPTPGRLAAMDPGLLAMPATRRSTVLTLARALADGAVDLSPGADPAAAVEALAALPGIGPWTVGSVAMRALGDRDAFLPGDLGVRLAAQRLGLPPAPGALTRRAELWRPFRAYAVQHLWATGDHPVNHLPP